MALLKNNAVIEDPFTDVSGRETIPAQGAVLVNLDQWPLKPTLPYSP